MAQANVFYKGEEKKFAINIQAAGFDMDTDDFELEVTNGKESFSVLKTGEPDENGRWANQDESLVVFYETVTPEEGDPYKEWFGILDTQFFNSTGQLNAVGTAYITDTKASGSVRKSIDVAILGTLKNK